MNIEEITKELKEIESKLLDQNRWQSVELTRIWAKKQPNTAGVYMLFHDGVAVYVGETGKLSGRMTDMLDSRHHTVRRSIGEKYYFDQFGYAKATSKNKHPAHIELMVETHLKRFMLSVLAVPFGRKEVEEYIFEQHNPALNRKSKRGGTD